jgi:integration host factor subunit beta
MSRCTLRPALGAATIQRAGSGSVPPILIASDVMPEITGNTSPDGRIRTMTRADLIAAITSRFPTLTAKDADIAVREILDAIGQSLAQGKRVEIRGFGSFSLNYRPPRKGRNPKSGEPVSVPAKYVPHFKPGKEMRAHVEESVKDAPFQQAI